MEIKLTITTKGGIKFVYTKHDYQDVLDTLAKHIANEDIFGIVKKSIITISD